jgi:glycosyltransferase involved in cell wall biosynthesis
MHILQLVNRIPYPLNDGGNIGVHYYTIGYLEAGQQLSMLAMNTTRHWLDEKNWPSWIKQLHQFRTVKVDNSIRPLPALKALITNKSYNIERFISKAYAQALQEILQANTYDVVQLEGLFLAPYIGIIRKYSKAKIVIRQHNIEYIIWERLARRAHNPLKKWYLAKLAQQLKAFEENHLNDYDLVLPISPTDYQLYEQWGTRSSMLLHPFGIDVDAIPFYPYLPQQPISLYHIGAMDWLPNQESVDWLLDNVMPVIHKKLPHLVLHLAGRNMPERYTHQQWPNVVVHGEVPDAQAFERDKSILLVPLQSGGGVRIKIFQAMAMGKAIVTTSVGVEGIAAQQGQEVMIADTPENFAQAILDLVQQPNRITNLGTQARTLMTLRYDRKKLIQQLLDQLQRL